VFTAVALSSFRLSEGEVKRLTAKNGDQKVAGVSLH